MSIQAFNDSVGFLPSQESFFRTGIKGVEDSVKPGEKPGIRSYCWLTSLFLRLVGVQVVQARDVTGKVHYFSRESMEKYIFRLLNSNIPDPSPLAHQYQWPRIEHWETFSQAKFLKLLERELSKKLGPDSPALALAQAQHDLYTKRSRLQHAIAGLVKKAPLKEIKKLEDKIVDIEKKLGFRK